MLEKIVSQVNGIVWNPALVVLLIAAGLYFSFRRKAAAEAGSGEAAKPKLNSLTLIIVVFVAVGIAAGYLFLPDGFIAQVGNLLTITLCMLLVLVGIDIGTDL